jgi:peptidoglycan/xylan/chitin deacetylase (PgdA/CDA1 family)
MSHAHAGLSVLSAAAALASATFSGVHAFAPRSQLYGKSFIGNRGKGKTLALTFDDGPNPAATPKLLEILARHNVRATFFLIGRFVQQEPALARDLVAAGHEVANHTQDHPFLILAASEEVKRQLMSCEAALAAAAVPNLRRLFRPPYGARRPRTLKTVRELGLTPVSWTITCYDWKPTTAERVEFHAMRQIVGGDVILLHDGGHLALNADRMHTVNAVASMVPKLIDRGYEFVTIGDWIRDSTKASDASSGSLSHPDTP